MRTKGMGPQGLGIKGNNGYSIGSPNKFKEHSMYSKSGAEEIAETKQEHLALKKKGYGHESPVKQTKKSLEHRAEEYLGFPQENARARTDEYLGIKEDENGLKKEHNSFKYGDTARHYLAGDETSRSIQEKLKGFGKTFLGKTIAGIGSNVGGLIHEAQNIADGRPIVESVEDATNNLAGSIGAFLPKKASTKLLDWYKEFAPDGKVKSTKTTPFKQTRTRTVEKGYDPVNEAVDPGYKKVVIIRGDKKIVKEKYTDETGRKRKVKTKYKGYSGTFVAEPDVAVSKIFKAKGGGGGRQKEDLLKSPIPKKDACYTKVASRYKGGNSAYRSGAMVKCRKVGVANWGNKSK